MENQKKDHWENVYKTKLSNELSWTQETPETSLKIIQGFKVEKTAKIIDIGGGDSKLVDKLLEEGYENITVLDISKNAILRAQNRLGENAKKVTWIESDINDFQPTEVYDVWHDRATFHFLTTEAEIAHYLKISSYHTSGFLSIATFSENGPQKCSGLEIKQYSESQMESAFEKNFSKMNCFTEIHKTPFNTEQSLIFCNFKKVNKEFEEVV